MRKLFFVGVLMAGLFCNTFAVLAKENGTEECDAALKEVLRQARGITASITESATLLSEINPLVEEVKAEVKKTMPELAPNQGEDVFERREYDEAIRRYFGKNSRPKLKND